MKPSDILPLLGRVKLPGGTEGRLLRDRLDKRLGLAVTAAGALVQLITQAATRENYLQNLPKFLFGFVDFVRLLLSRNWTLAAHYHIVPGLTGIVILIGGLIIYLLIVIRGLIKQYSEEAFRYTFWINQFQKAEGESEKAATGSDADPLHHLLHHDLMERLSLRIGRLSLIDDTNVAADDKALLSSHIHIDGHYTVRRVKGNKKVIHVMPRIRIGPPEMPWNLTRPIQVALKEQSPKGTEPPLLPTPDGPAMEPELQAGLPAPASRAAVESTPLAMAPPSSKPAAPSLVADSSEKTNCYGLTAEDYGYIVERVYSNIATEIYNQIKSDLNTKIELFPGKYLRAIALYHEAEDFARSNTVDAYDHAIELYRQARGYFEGSLRARLVKLLLFIPGLPIGTSIQIMRAKTEIGYAKCVIYRRKISALSGRYKNPLFEVSGIMTAVVRRLIDVHNRHRSRPLRLEIPWPFAEEREVLLQVDDIHDPVKLFEILRNDDTLGELEELKSIRQAVRRGLSPRGLRNVKHENPDRIVEALPTIVRALNRILKTERLHYRARDENVPTPKEDKTLVLLNRILLDEAFANAITPYQTRQKDAHSKVRQRSTMVFLASKGRVWEPGVQLIRKKAVAEDLLHIMFEAYLVAALAYADLGAWQRAANCRALAKAIAPAISEHHPLYLLAAGSIEPAEVKATPLLTRAAEIDPDFQIAKYLLADRIANQFRMAAEFTRQRVAPIVDKYEDVLRLNPGNVAALAAQGYLWWLVGNREAASSKFAEGCEIKAVVSETFIGELYYGLARVAAETGDFDASYDLYMQAIAADPGLAAALVTASRFATTSYYNHIGPAMLARYEDFLGRVESFIVRFSPKDLIKPEAFARQLTERQTPLAAYIASAAGLSSGAAATADFSGLIETLNRVLADAEFYDKERFRDQLLNEDTCELISKGPTCARLALRNRLLLEAAFPQHVRRCFDDKGAVNPERSILNTRKQPISLRAVDAVYSYVLNDYGNACLNYYLGFGEADVLAAAIAALDHSTKIHSTNAVAFFNLSTAYSHENNSTDKVIEYLEATERLSPAWPFVRTTSAVQKARDIRDGMSRWEDAVNYYQLQLDQAEAKKKELQTLLETTVAEEDAARAAALTTPASTPEQPKKIDDFLKEETQRATPAEKLQKTVQEIAATTEEVNRLKGYLQNGQEEEVEYKELFEKAFNDGLASIFQDTKLQPLFQRTGRDFVVTTIDKLLNDRTIDWTRLDEGDVHALQGCAELLSYSRSTELPALECGRKLAMHLLDRYYPENFDTNLVLYNIHTKLGSGGPRHAETTLAPVTEYWLAQRATHFNTVYYRHLLNLEQWTFPVVSDTEEPRPRGHYRLLGNVFFRLRRYKEALEAYGLAVEENPTEVANRISIAAVHDAQWQSDKELEELIEAQLLDPENLNVRNGLARLFAGKGWQASYMGHWQAAADQFQLAVKAAPYDPSYYWELGGAWEKLIGGDDGDPFLDQAIAAFEMANQLAPASRENQDRLEKLRSIKAWRACTWDDRFAPPGVDVSPVCIRVSPALVALLRLTNGPLPAQLKRNLNTMREDLWTSFGLKTPAVRFWPDAELPPGQYSVEFFEARVSWWENQMSFQTRELFSERKMFVGSSQELDDLGVPGEKVIDPLYGGDAFWIEAGDWKTLQRHGKQLLGMEECLTRHLSNLLSRQMSEFVGHQDVVELSKVRMPGSRTGLLEDSEELRAFTLILKAFLDERVPIIPLASIHQRFVNMWRAGMPLHTIVEKIRQAPEMRSLLPGNWFDLKFYRLSAAAETFLESALDQSGSQPVLALEPDACQVALTRVREFVDARGGGGFALVVLNTEVRAHLRRLVQLEFPYLWILSEEEIKAEKMSSIQSDFELELTATAVGAVASGD